MINMIGCERGFTSQTLTKCSVVYVPQVIVHVVYVHSVTLLSHDPIITEKNWTYTLLIRFMF